METIKFFADECTFGVTVSLIKKLGYDILRAQQIGLTGSPDAVIYHKAQELNRILLTNDQGFGDIRQYPPSRHSGIIVIKIVPDPEAMNEIHQVLTALLNRETEFTGTLYVVDRVKYRKRTLP